MNRRDFIKKASVMGALTTWTVTCQYEEEKEQDPKGHEGETGEVGANWDYRVYCYERGQGEWVFSENIKGSFAPEREYLTLDEERKLPYVGWMDGGKLHFATLQEAEDFIGEHFRAKDDTHTIESIYDVFYVAREKPTTLDEEEGKEVEIHVAHHWYKDGNQIQWQAQPPYSDINKMEFA